MPFSVRALRRVLRRRSSSSSAARGLNPELETFLRDFKTSVSPSILPLKTLFPPTAGGPPAYVCLHAIGTFLEPGLIVTSALSVARVIERGSGRHKADVGRTVAVTAAGKHLRTKPLAVSFANDVAVLKVVNLDGETFPHCALASSAPPKGSSLLSIPHPGIPNSESVILVGKVRATEERTIKEVRPPWPRDDRLGWLEYIWYDYPVFGPLSDADSSTDNRSDWPEKLDVTFGEVSGIPWFNIRSELVGIGSWEAVFEDSGDSLGFAVPSSWIGDVVEYAKTKGPEDPVVMDSWADAPGDDYGGLLAMMMVLGSLMDGCVGVRISEGS